MEVSLEGSWKQRLEKEFDKPYFHELVTFVKNAYSSQVCYPLGKNIFNTFESCPFENVKVVILGQDPYHGPGQAHGLSFSVPEGIKPPPSLVNMFKEINRDLNIEIPKSGNLQRWADQGVLLLNATLSVQAHMAGSHQGKGWEIFTDAVIHSLSTERTNLVFMLWGSYAQKKGAIIDSSKHLVLKAPHPSPLSAHRGFIGCGHFSQANAYISSKGKELINW
jgi:uracil-DNA glycosylase